MSGVDPAEDVDPADAGSGSEAGEAAARTEGGEAAVKWGSGEAVAKTTKKGFLAVKDSNAPKAEDCGSEAKL